MNCGQATIRLLELYGVDTVFGIPGVHTLEFCRGLNDSNITHIQARNEQGAGFMADGYARTSGRPGVALVISGPGATNALTAIGQAYADSIPVLLLSSDAASDTLGKGWGALHEVPRLTDVTAPLTALAATAMRPQDVPELLAQAFSIFASARPRPVHIAIPTDVLAMVVEDDWQPATLPSRPAAHEDDIARACALLAQARRPLICLGGGAWQASEAIRELVERIGAAVITSTAGKGIVPDEHPLSLGARTMYPEAQAFISRADVILALGTELSETDSFSTRFDITGQLIRVDVDARMMNGLYPADMGIVADVGNTLQAMLSQLTKGQADPGLAAEIHAIKRAQLECLDASQKQHARAINHLRAMLPEDVIIMGDICQLVYTGAFAFAASRPRQWHYPAGFCTLGCGLPNAIGARLALPDRPVVCFVGDGGFMFTVQELVTAAELKLPIPIILWVNGGLKQIRDDMVGRGIEPVGVTGINPEFIRLAESCHCYARHITDARALEQALAEALVADRPTLIQLNENDPWLLD